MAGQIFPNNLFFILHFDGALQNRYLLTEWRWHDGRVDESLTESVIVGILRQCVAVNFGDIGAGAALSSVAVKYWNPRRAWAWFDAGATCTGRFGAASRYCGT